MWILLLLSVNISNPQDVPGRVTLEFSSQQACEQAKASMTYWLKFDSFKITAECQPKS
jgi:hypothetical protein